MDAAIRYSRRASGTAGEGLGRAPAAVALSASARHFLISSSYSARTLGRSASQILVRSTVGFKSWDVRRYSTGVQASACDPPYEALIKPIGTFNSFSNSTPK